jgi:hypothetical protein
MEWFSEGSRRPWIGSGCNIYPSGKYHLAPGVPFMIIEYESIVSLLKAGKNLKAPE